MDVLRRDERLGVSFRPIFKKITDVYYKTPELHLQEFRTKLSTLVVGHRLVRDLDGVREEHVVLPREPWALGLTARRNREAIERIRRQPIYRSPSWPQLVPQEGKTATAADRLRRMGEKT
jgi:hypothetical protein